MIYHDHFYAHCQDLAAYNQFSGSPKHNIVDYLFNFCCCSLSPDMLLNPTFFHWLNHLPFGLSIGKFIFLCLTSILAHQIALKSHQITVFIRFY